MIEHEASIHLNRPVEQVFAYLADIRNLATWQANILEQEQLTEGLPRVGTRFREIRRLGRWPTEILAELTVFEPDKRFATKTLTRPQVTVSYSFEPEGGGTRLLYEFVMVTSGMMRLFEPLIARALKKQSVADFERLKRVLEVEHQTASSALPSGKMSAS